jgi:hypothetical protein
MTGFQPTSQAYFSVPAFVFQESEIQSQSAFIQYIYGGEGRTRGGSERDGSAGRTLSQRENIRYKVIEL